MSPAAATPTWTRSSRQLRTVQLAAGVMAGAVLLGSTLFGFAAALRASRVIVDGHGEHLLHEIRRAHPPDRPLDEATIDGLLARLGPEGLRCVAVFDVDGRPLLERGDCSVPIAQLATQLDGFMPGQSRPAGERYQALHRLPPMGPPPPPPPGAAAPPPPGAGAWPPPGALGPHRWPFLIEFDPLPEWQLRGSALVTLLAGAVGAIVLIGAAVFNARLVARAEALQGALEREQHLATLGEMSAVLAHELRNPLASLKGHAQLMAEGAGDDERVRERAGILVREALRLEALCEQLLSFVRANRVEPVDTNPAMLLREACGSIPEASVVLHVDRAPARWRLDPLRIQQALTNLLQNAVQASPASVPSEATVREDGDALVFEVRDFGRGVPPEEMARIFEPFHTTRVRGTGLGLAVTRRIVELHGGTVDVQNHPDGGAVFRMRLPRT